MNQRRWKSTQKLVIVSEAVTQFQIIAHHIDNQLIMIKKSANLNPNVRIFYSFELLCHKSGIEFILYKLLQINNLNIFIRWSKIIGIAHA